MATTFDRSAAAKSGQRDPRVMIIGAGMSGIAIAHTLKQAGFDNSVILEKGSDVGGVWHWNRYPGLTCDIPSHMYQFAFAPKPVAVFTHWPQSTDPVVAQHVRCLTVLGVGDGLMPGPHPLVIGDGLAVTEHRDPIEIRDDLDTPADHRRVHRVIVGVQPDVVIARQPGVVAPPHLRNHRRQRQHRLAVRADPIGRRAPQHAALSRVDHGQSLAKLVVEIARAGEGSAGQK